MSDDWSYTTAAGPGLGWCGDASAYSYAGPPTGDWGRGVGASVAGIPKGRANPRQPAISGHSGWSPTPDGGVILSKTIDDVVRAFGLGLYDQIAVDDQAASSLATLLYAIMGGDFTAEPAVELEPGESADDPKIKADLDIANRGAEIMRRSIARVPDLIDQLEAVEFDATIKGAGLGDPWQVVVQGPQDDKPVTLLGGLLCRSRDSWDFVVDGSGKAVGIAGIPVGGTQPAKFDRERFYLRVNSPRRGDPRGTSDLRAAYDSWNLKQQARPQRAKWVSQFANPTLDLGYDPESGDQDQYGPDGHPDPSLPKVSPQQQAEGAAAYFHSSSYLVHPVTWAATLIESKSDGGAFAANEEGHNTAIARAILLTARVTNESDRSSQADAYSSLDVFQMKVERRRKALCSAIERDIFKPLMRANFGDDAAERLCPRAVFKMAAHVQAEIIQAVTGLLNSGKVPTRIMPKMFKVMGLPVPEVADFEEMERKAEAAALAAQQAKAAQVGGGKGDEEAGDTGDGGKGNGKPTTGKPPRAPSVGSRSARKPARKPGANDESTGDDDE